MARKKRTEVPVAASDLAAAQESFQVDGVQLAPSAAPPPDDGGADRGGGPEKVSIPLTADGAADFGSMRDKTKEKLFRLVDSTPELVSRLSGSGEGVPEFATDQMVEGLYKALGGVIASVAHSRGLPPNVCGALSFQEREITMLTPPTQKVINKYIGRSMWKYQDEFTLVMVLAAVAQNKIAVLRSWREHERVRQHGRAADGPVPVPPVRDSTPLEN